MSIKADFVIVGAGIIGLSLARELKNRHREASIVVLEKESDLGKHGSGRNSGVLHSGIYYKEGTLKAKLCAEGAREMAAFCDEHNLPINRIGKVIIPVREGDDPLIDLLYQRAKANGAKVEILDAAGLKEMEPEAFTLTGRALWSPNTAVVNPLEILKQLREQLEGQGVLFILSQQVSEIDTRAASLKLGNDTLHYGHLFNSAGLHADRIAHAFGIGKQYTMLPFKGLYYKLSEKSGLKINHLIYPVPDLSVPFLGIHFTTKIDGGVYLGPTAIPAFGRENYSGVQDVRLAESSQILLRIGFQYLKNQQGFRQYAHEESFRFFKANFAKAAQALVPRMKPEYLEKSDKVGIRAQLLDKEKGELVMDFLVEHGERSTHILNAVSPGFTSAFTFSRMVIDQMGVPSWTSTASA